MPNARLRQPKSHEYKIHPAACRGIVGDRPENPAYHQSRWKTFLEGAGMNNTKNTSSVQRSKESQVEDFDLLILGGGTGSTIAAWTFAGEGMRVAIVDRKYI